MKEFCEFRVQEQHASRLFAPCEGKKLGWTKLFGDKFVTVRKVELSVDDPKFKRVGELEALIKKEPHGFFLRVGIYTVAIQQRKLEPQKFFS